MITYSDYFPKWPEAAAIPEKTAVANLPLPGLAVQQLFNLIKGKSLLISFIASYNY